MKHQVGLSELGQRTGAPAISWLMQLTLSRPGLISLAAGFTDQESLPVPTVRKLLNKILGSRKRGQAALQYGSTQGDAGLRRLTAEHLRRLDSPVPASRAYAAERMIITSGSQQLLYMTTEALCDPGDIVIVEDPTYFVFLGILQSRGIAARTVPLETDGLNVAHLERLLRSLQRSGRLKRVKAIYLVSYFQNPTGVTTAFAKKAAVLKLLKQFESAAGHPIYLIEDAAYRELRFRGEEVKSALSVRGLSDRVVYAGTYSKPFATGVRVGFGILPEPLFTAVLQIKGNHDFGTSNLLQQLLAHALESGSYQKHVRHLRRRYAEKAAIMRRKIKKSFPGSVEVWEPDGGLYFWIRLPEHISAGKQSQLFRAALANDVLYVPGELCYADDASRPRPHHEIRLSFGGARARDLPRGIHRLRRAIASL